MAKSKKIVDKVSGRLITASPEEVNATQPLLGILLEECGWKPDQIVSKPNQWRVPANPSGNRSWPVDVAIFDSPEHKRDPDHVQILCECKRPDETTGVDQLKIYLDREPHARMGIWFNGVDHTVVYKTRDGYTTAPLGTPIPGPSDPLHPGKKSSLLTYPLLREAPSLVPLFKRIRNRLAAQDRNVNRDEEILPDISSLLLLKILDEQANRSSPKRPLSFQLKSDNRKETAQHIKQLLQDKLAKHTDVFGTTELSLSIDDDSTSYIVEELQNYRLLSNDIDSISTAFQVIRGKAYKGEEGQFFTPPSVVRIAVAAVVPTVNDRVIDPACGSGSFLATTFNTVLEDLKSFLKEDSADYGIAKRDWSTQNLHALDKDSVSVRLTKAYLSLLGDGSSHVFKADSLRKRTWERQLSETIPDNSFNVVLTNPPFGTKLKIDAKSGQSEGYEVCKKWSYDKATNEWTPTDKFQPREIGIVFLERCINLLEPGGRLAIVLPDTYLFSPSYQWLVAWLCKNFTITHSINVPIEAFEPHCRAKTSILVLQKEKPKFDHKVIGVLSESFGEDKHGHPLYRLDAEGKQTSVREDEMAEAVKLLKSSYYSESKLKFHFAQSDAAATGVLVASYHWRRPYEEALRAFATANNCALVSIAELVKNGDLTRESGHGSPSSHFKGKGTVPYIKVSDIKNWRINENSKYFIPHGEANRLRGSRRLKPYDLVTPTRASKNIGLLGVVMPWQTHIVLTKEILIFRVPEQSRVSPWLILVLMSLRVVNDQFRYLVQMQTNREDLGERILELQVPLPNDLTLQAQWEDHARGYLKAMAAARSKYSKLLEALDEGEFVDRP